MKKPTTPFIFAITGLDGSGKSSASKLLAQELEGTVIANVWDPLAKSGLFKDQSDVNNYLKQLASNARSLFIFHAIFQSLHLALEKKPSIILWDGGPYKYAASEIAMGGCPQLVRSLIQGLPQPHATYFLDVCSEDAWIRKDQTSSYERQFSADDSGHIFIQSQKKILLELKKLELEMGPWIHIPQTGSSRETATLLKREFYHFSSGEQTYAE